LPTGLVVNGALDLRVSGQQQGMELLAERGERDAAAGPLEQLPADLALQGGDQPTDPRLGDAQLVRRVAEVQFLGEREEGFRLRHVRRQPLSCSPWPAAFGSNALRLSIVARSGVDPRLRGAQAGPHPGNPG
jgi:hypothetical protein